MEDKREKYYIEKIRNVQQMMIDMRFVEAEHEAQGLRREMDDDAEVPCEIKSDVYYKLYHLAWIRKDKENAFTYAEKAIELHPNNDAKVQIYCNMAMNTLQIGEFDESDVFTEKAIQLISTDTPSSWYAYLIKGKINQARGNIDSSLDYFTHSAQEANRLHMSHGEIAATICVAEMLFQKGLVNNALSEIIRMEQYARRTSQMQQYLRVVIKKSQFLFRMGQDEEAKQVILAIPEFND